MNWIFVFKVLMMNDCWVASQILLHISKKPFSIGSSSEEERKCKGILQKLVYDYIIVLIIILLNVLIFLF